jgi:GntR family transcriptional regulator/MocR family aminotransferase
LKKDMVYINRDSKVSLYEQIFRQIKNEIEVGTIQSGEMLPGIRSLAKTLGVARNTVEKAYTQLSVEGYIYPRVGAGYVAVEWVESNIAEKPEKRGRGCAVINDQQMEDALKTYDFQYGDFPNNCFPAGLWKKYTSEILFSSTESGISVYQKNQGNDTLRRELAKYLKQSRGVSCDEEQIIVGCGLHYSLDIICKLFRDTRRIAVEEPGYNGARDVFVNNGFSLELLPSRCEGLSLSVLEKMDVPAVYVTPSHQFPWGTVMSIANRKRILKWAVEKDAYIIEDDYDSEYRYDANPVPSLQSLDSEERVIYVGTFSKSLSPSLRVNYMILPKKLLLVYQRLFASYTSPVSWLTQEVLAAYLRTGEYTRHVRKMCKIYQKKHDIILRELNQQFGNAVQIHGKGAGMHFLLEFTEGFQTDKLIETVKKEGVWVYPAEPYWYWKKNCPSNLVFMGYSLIDNDKINAGIKLLRQNAV